MKVITKELKVPSQGNTDIINITEEVNREIRTSGLSRGNAVIFISGATAGVTTVEYEDGLVHDLKEMFSRLIPEQMDYSHNERWKDGNGHSHVRASLLGPSLTVPFRDQGMILGRWQQVILVDFDVRPRMRELIIQLTGCE